MMVKRTILLVLLLSNTLFSFGQERIALSLEECVKIGIEKNINVEKARLNKRKDEYKISEVKSALLPSITGSGQMIDNIQLPYTILPGDLIGQPGTDIAIKMGVRHTAKASVDVNQVLYNQTAFTGLRLAKRQDELSTLSVEKAGQDLAKDLISLYFLAQTTARQKELVKDNIVRTQKVEVITRALLNAGMVKNVDYDRIVVNLENMQTMLSNTEALHSQQLNMIKYTLELPLATDITLTDSVAMPLLVGLPEEQTDFSNHVSIRMLDKQRSMTLLNRKLINAGYLPSLAAFGQWGYQGMNNEFYQYFDGGKWFSSTYVGLSLSIPIFDGFERRSKRRQARLETQEVDLTLENTKNLFEVSYRNALDNFHNNSMNVGRQKNNIALAEKIYSETVFKYKEGMASMSDLLQDESGLSSAQDNYITALYNQKKAELEVMMLTGEINKLINKK